MTDREMFNQMVATGEATRVFIDEFFYLLSQDTLVNQIEMNLTPNDFGTEYTTITGKVIKVIN